MSKYKPRFLQSPFCTKRAELLRKLICWYLKRHPLNRWAFKAHTHRHVLRAESKATCTRERCVSDMYTRALRCVTSPASDTYPKIEIQIRVTYVVYWRSASFIDKFPDPDPRSSKMTDGKKRSWTCYIFEQKLSPVTALLRSKARSEGKPDWGKKLDITVSIMQENCTQHVI